MPGPYFQESVYERAGVGIRGGGGSADRGSDQLRILSSRRIRYAAFPAQQAGHPCAPPRGSHYRSRQALPRSFLPVHSWQTGDGKRAGGGTARLHALPALPGQDIAALNPEFSPASGDGQCDETRASIRITGVQRGASQTTRRRELGIVPPSQLGHTQGPTARSDRHASKPHTCYA